MTVLDDIVAGVRADLADRERAVPRDRLEAQLASVVPPLDPMPAFRADGISVIAEVKRRSPSRGDLAAIADPSALAAAYAEGGAAAVSVLTERRRFSGSLDDLRSVRATVPGTPLLRKDFVVTPYQVVESRVAGADLVLLIVAALDDPALGELYSLAVDLGMAVLVEVHERDEVSRAADLGAELIGINARNLKTLDVHPGAFAELAPLLPTGTVRVAESGISGAADVRRYAGEGADVVLVGEALVRAAADGGDPAQAVAGLVGAGSEAQR